MLLSPTDLFVHTVLSRHIPHQLYYCVSVHTWTTGTRKHLHQIQVIEGYFRVISYHLAEDAACLAVGFLDETENGKIPVVELTH